MGWKIAQQKGKFRIWSTVSDAWLTDWMTREEALKFYYDDALLRFEKQFIEKYLSFPHHWPEHGNGQRAVIVNQEGRARYLAWMHELTCKSDEEYSAFIDETFKQITEDF
jgi:hypothetical protein